MAKAGITIAVILAWIASGIVSSLALVAFLELCFGKVAATREKWLGGGSGLRGQRPETNANNFGVQVQNQLQNPGSMTGRIGQ